MSRQHHYIKILPEYYIAVDKGIKTFEIRFNDRNYKVGDILHLQEFCGGQYTSRELQREISYMIDDPNYCKEGFVVLGLNGGERNMAITKEQAIDILEKFDFFEGQRAGRELWVEKPAEVQEQDISNFSRDVHLLKEYITSDVIPRVEMDDLIYKLECLLCHATGGKLSYHTYPLATMERAVTDYIQECYDEAYAEARAEVAREIVTDIADLMWQGEDEKLNISLGGRYYSKQEFIAELKKKYPSEDTEL